MLKEIELAQAPCDLRSRSVTSRGRRISGAYRRPVPRRSSVAAGEGAHLVLHFNTNTTIWISPCRWKKLADGLGGKLAFSPLRNRRSRFASERGRIKNIRGRCAVENPGPHRTTASDIFYSLSFSRTERRRTRGAPVGSRRPFSSIGLHSTTPLPAFGYREPAPPSGYRL